jgi:drug/metabolite transporter (DMT)-like permease
MSETASSINYRLGSLYSVVTAFLYATQEPFSFPAAKHLNTLQFVALTQVSLLVSIPLLLSRSTSRRDFLALIRKPINYGYLAVIFAIGLTGLLLYNFGLSNAHPIIISAILNLSPFWAALVALFISRVPIPISPSTFFGCFAGAFIGAMAVAWSQLGDAGGMSTISQLADNFVHGSWLYAIPVPLCSALGGTLVGKWFASYDESAAIAANFLTANVILIPGCLAILYWRNELNFNELWAILLMIFGTIVAASLGRVMYQISLTVTGGDNGFVTMFLNLVPALTAFISLGLSHWIADLHFVIDLTFFLGSGLIAASLVLFSLKSWRQPAQRA